MLLMLIQQTKKNKQDRKNLNNLLKKRYNITLEKYFELFYLQNGLCAICGKPETTVYKNSCLQSRLCIDHDHNTKKIRGLLCSKCNTALGHFKDDIEIIEKAILYLKKQR